MRFERKKPVRGFLLLLLIASLVLPAGCAGFGSASPSDPLLPTVSLASGFRIADIPGAATGGSVASADPAADSSAATEVTSGDAGDAVRVLSVSLVPNPAVPEAVLDACSGDGDLKSAESDAIASRLGQILYNVPPEGASDVMRFAAVFEYLCETADFAPDMAGTKLAGTDSVLLNGAGICYDFASLLEALLPQLGIPCVMISNRVHAWNQAVLDGVTYHSDLSMAVGSFGARENSFRTFLMDDNNRRATFSASAASGEEAVVGLFGESSVTPPPATGDTYEALSRVRSVYALDPDNGQIFYGDDEGIHRMRLDGSGAEVLSERTASAMAWYDGTLYYLSYDNGCLYALTPGESPLLVDGDGPFRVLYRSGAAVCYGVSVDDVKCLYLAPTAADLEAAGSVASLGTSATTAGQSYYLTVTFSAPMSEDPDFLSYIVLVDDDGNPLATRRTWNADRTVLTVRPLDDISDQTSLRLFVVSGMPASGVPAIGQTICFTISG